MTGEQLNLVSIIKKKNKISQKSYNIAIFIKAFIQILVKGPFCSCFYDKLKDRFNFCVYLRWRVIIYRNASAVK